VAHGTVRLEREGSVARVVLDRPDIRNAFNDEMLADLRAIFVDLRCDPCVRAVILTGEGRVFCGGADLHWMRRVVDYSPEESFADSLALAETLHEIYTCPRPVVGRVNGPAIGGGTGLVAVCDIAIASTEAFFAFTETKLGLTPAAISPYLLKRMGEKNLREYFLTGERFPAERAAQLGLVNAAVPPELLDSTVSEKISHILTGGPEALTASKELLRGIAERDLERNKTYTAEVITRLRVSQEGQEGMKAFLEKRRPRWVEE
jgi:methylglutaconyl-CoA hydratase